MKPKSTTGSKDATINFRFDRSGVRTVSYEDRADDLINLPNIDVFNQHDLEQGLLLQANDAFEQDCKRQKCSLENELSSINEDIRLCEGELASIGELLERSASDEGGFVTSEVRQRTTSVKKQEQNKVSQLRTLNSRKYSLEQKLKRLSEIPKEAIQPSGILEGFVAKETEGARRVRLGETTPFQGRKRTGEERKTEKVEFRSVMVHSNPLPKLPQTLPRTSSNAKRAKSCESNEVGDEEWRPKGDEDDDVDDDCYEDLGSDVSFETDEEMGVPKGPKRKFKRKRVRLGRKGKSLEDDWCEEVYKSRIRELRPTEVKAEADENDEALDGGFTVPRKLWERLFPYQRTGVRWLWELHSQEVGGILGDEMGLGKTVQVVALLASLQYSNLEDKSMVPRYRGLGPTLIICPATVMHQWLKEFRTWWPRLRVVIVHNNSGASSLKAGRLMATLFPPGSGKGDSLVVISSYSTVHRHSGEFLCRPWHYLVLDEGHKIRNPDAQITLVCKQFKTCHRLIVSGSPVQNNLKELWSLFDFVFPGKLGTLPDFMSNFNVPIAQGQYATSSDVQVETAYKCAETLRDIISPYLLRRMKKDVQSSISLPNKNEQVLFCRLTDYQRRVYKEFLSSREFKMIVEGRTMAFSGLITVRKICNHPDICTGTPRSFWDAKEEEERGDTYGYWKRSGKMVVIEALLSMWRKQRHKVLLFTQSRQMLDIIESFVKSRSYTYFRMDGATSVQTRQPLIAEFNKNPNVFLFLLTTRVGGLGINLTGASRVVIYDPDWNPSTDVQARERAWRIGQKADVTVYRLLTTGTIEEKIYQRQIFKQFLTNRVLSDPRQRRFFDSSDLRELFTLKEEGDEGRQTETGAIFAGTGSEVKVSKKKARKRRREKETENGRRKTSEEGTVNRFDLLKEGALAPALVTNDYDDDDDGTFVGLVESEKSGRCGGRDATVSRGVPDSARFQSIPADGENHIRVEEGRPSSSPSIAPLPRIDPSRAAEEGGEKPPSTPSIVVPGSDPSGHSAEKEEEEEEDYDEETKRRMDLARMLSRKISEMMAVGKNGSCPNSDRRERRKHKSLSKNARLEGEKIKNLDRIGKCPSGPAEEEEKEEGVKERRKKSQKGNNDDDDDYVLKKLFKKSGVHSALHHERIVASGDPDHRLVEMEAERVARDAERALTASRERCRRAALGQPTWTGTNGSAGAPRFGPRKPIVISGSLKVDANDAVKVKKAELPDFGERKNSPKQRDPSSTCRFDGSTLVRTAGATSTATAATTEKDVKTQTTKAKVKNGNDGEDTAVEIRPDLETERSRGRDERVLTSSDLISMLKSKARPAVRRDADPGRRTPPCADTTPEVEADDLELVEDIRAFVAVGGSRGPGRVTTEELVGHFGSRVPGRRSAVFKEMTRRLCDFYRVDGLGVFALRSEHRRES